MTESLTDLGLSVLINYANLRRGNKPDLQATAPALTPAFTPGPYNNQPSLISMNDAVRPPNPKVFLTLSDLGLTPDQLFTTSAQWPVVEESGIKYFVAPDYIHPMGIGEGDSLIKSLPGFELPSPELVNAIYKAADLKLPFHPQAHNGTAAEMNAPKLLAAQDAYIANQIRSTNPNYRLLAGTHKDIVRSKPEGTALAYQQKSTLGIYGAHKADGAVTQAFMWGHAHGASPGSDWKDYSQGLRLVRRV